jgi:anti-sigma factor RsiW
VQPKITEQDLCDYALDELGPEERLYVESMLGVSEEDREDVYGMIDVAMMLEEGFEIEAALEPVGLTDAQRAVVLEVHLPNRVLRNLIGVLAAAACVAIGVMTQGAWLPKVLGPKMARASVASIAAKIEANEEVAQGDIVTAIENFRELVQDPIVRKLFFTRPGSAPAASGPVIAPSAEAPARMSLDFMP